VSGIDPVSLAGRTALVTGAGRGLGRAHARLLARLGASVVVNDTGVDPLGADPDPRVADEVVAELRAAGRSAVADHSDIGTFAGAAAAVAHAVSEFGRLDILINNAGTLHTAPLEQVGEGEVWTDLRVHAVGAIATMQAAFPIMRAQRWGRILNTVSEAALHTDLASGVAYSTAKAAVWGATMAGAHEGRPHAITVNALSPGALTRMSERFLAEQGIPPGLDLSPDRAAEAVVWLFTDAASGVTGRVLHTAGGHVREFVLSRTDQTEVVAAAGALAASLRAARG
jgi:NAD(P)-dependent dehydrogenase (short-subunit alcohol dehydrogenase family)